LALVTGGSNSLSSSPSRYTTSFPSLQFSSSPVSSGPLSSCAAATLVQDRDANRKAAEDARERAWDAAQLATDGSTPEDERSFYAWESLFDTALAYWFDHLADQDQKRIDAGQH